MTAPASRSDEATEMYRALRDVVWDLRQHYEIGALAIAQHAVDKYKARHPEMR
jgi:hypothetical protein